MSKLIALFATTLTLMSATAFAGSHDTITDSKAYLTFSYCPKGVSDCGDQVRIIVKGKIYMPVANTPSIKQTLANVIGSYQFHKLASSAKFSVTGYSEVRTNTGGWGPRTYTVFVITQSTMNSIPLPK